MGIPSLIETALTDVLLPVSQNALAAVLGGVAGGIAAAVGAWIAQQHLVEQTLVSEVSRVLALDQAWVVVGPDYRTVKLSERGLLPPTATFSDTGPNSLFSVEIRAVLDEGVWVAPKDPIYQMVGPGRAWIVRDNLAEASQSYEPRSGGGIVPRPALLSSRGRHELSAVVERVASAYSSRFLRRRLLTRQGEAMLQPLLIAVAGEDRLKVLDRVLTPSALSYLRGYRQRHPEFKIRG